MKLMKIGGCLFALGFIGFAIGGFVAVSTGYIFLPLVFFGVAFIGMICCAVGGFTQASKDVQESQKLRAQKKENDEDEESNQSSDSVGDSLNKLGSEISQAASAGVRKLKKWLNSDVKEAPTKCPNCNANLINNNQYVKCQYCGFKKQLW